MTVQEFLNQAYRLDLRIRSEHEELDRLRDMAQSITSPGFEEHISGGSKEAPFARQVEKIVELEKTVDDEIIRLLDLRKQIHDTINTLKDPDERMIVQFRYIDRLTWNQIAKKMFADATTIRRKHQIALTRIKMPSNPIEI